MKTFFDSIEDGSKTTFVDFWNAVGSCKNLPQWQSRFKELDNGDSVSLCDSVSDVGDFVFSNMRLDGTFTDGPMQNAPPR